MHDHGRDVEWSLVLFVATGEEGSADDGPTRGAQAEALGGTEALGGSLLLKTQLGAAAHSQHGFLCVPPTPGELWAFPGYLSHCVMPRMLGSPTTAPPMEAEQRVSVALNIYAAASTAALDFVEKNMPAVLEAHSRAAFAMEAMRKAVARP